MDISYIPIARGFVYLAAVIDWFSGRVLSWRLSIAMDTSFCIEALDEALNVHGKPEIFNTDQGSQFTGEAFTGRLKEEGIQISMDGRRRWADNVFVERLWRSLKYEHVYLHAYESVGEARTKIGRYFEFYNCRRPHSSLGAQTPTRYTSTPRQRHWRRNAQPGGRGGLSARSAGVGGPVFDRGGLPDVPVSTALARWLRMPALRQPEGVASVASAVGMREVPSPEFGDGGNDFSGQPPSADIVVSSGVVGDQPEEWGKRHGLAARARLEELQNGLDYAA